jgi:hypothetical protein
MTLGPAQSPDSGDQNLVFISYSHADAKWLTRLRVHLKPLERHGTIVPWDDTRIKPGTEWREEIRNALKRARVAVLLVSADFLASDFIATNELPPLLESAEARGTLILPLILNHCRFVKTEGLSRFQAVNNPAKPLATLDHSARAAWFEKLSGVIEEALTSTAKEPRDPLREEARPKEASAKPRSRELARRHELRLRFWAQLLDSARKKGLPYHINRSPSTSNWIGGKTGIAGCRWNYVIWMDDAGAVELDIDTGDKRKNKRLFDALRSRKAEIEDAFGAPLEWLRLDNARRSGIRYIVEEGGLTAPQNEWPKIQNGMIEAMARLSKVLDPYLHGRAGNHLKEDRLAQEVRFERYTVRRLMSGTIEVERDGEPAKPAKPVLRELASMLNLRLENRSGNPMNTRQLGSLVIETIEKFG